MSEAQFHKVVEQGVLIGFNFGLAWGFGIFIAWQIARHLADMFRARRVQRQAAQSWPEHRGFTLVELLIVCSIICTLIGLGGAAAGMVRSHSIRNITNVTKRFDRIVQALPDQN